MGSDLARLGLPALNDLPPFRNASPGPPDSLPSLAQLGCPAPSSAAASSSWTAVNHRPQGSSSSALRDIDSIPDRAPDAHTDHNHTHNHQLQTGGQHAPHPPIRPNSTSHLGRRPHRPKLAPKRPIGSHQDSATSESPSPKVPAERSPEAPDAAYGAASVDSAIVSPLAQSPVLASGLGSSRHARAAPHPLTNPHLPLDPPKYSQCPPPQERNLHPFTGTYQPSSSNGHHAGAIPVKGGRPRQPLHKDDSPSASAAPPALPKPPALPRRRSCGALAADGRAAPVETMAEMAPPLIPPREHRFPSNATSTTRKSPPSPIAFARPAPYLSEAQPTMPHSADAASASSVSSSVPAAENGHARLTTNGEPRAEPGTVRSNRSPSLQGNRASPAASSTMDELPRCQICNEVYHPSPSMDPQTLRAAVTDIRPADAQSLDAYNQTMENFADMIRGHIRHPDSDFNEWRERHRHDSEDTSTAPARVAEVESQSEAFHSNKRKRLSDSENQPEPKRYYAFQPTSGDTVVFVTHPIAALFPGDGVPREPYVPPPENNHNMWYIPPEEPKRKARHLAGKSTTPSEADAQRGESASEHKDGNESAPQPRRKSSGAAPLDKILHS